MRRRREPSWNPTSVRGIFDEALVTSVFGFAIMGVLALARWIASLF